jgi:hypothetical protein
MPIAANMIEAVAAELAKVMMPAGPVVLGSSPLARSVRVQHALATWLFPGHVARLAEVRH